MSRSTQAARLDSLGFWPLLIAENAKHAIEKFKNKGPTDIDYVLWRLRRNPRLNLSVRLPDLVALDADDEPAMNIIRRYDTPWIQRSPSGGEHRLFRLPEGLIANCRTRINGIGLDLKTGPNSYLLTAPSEIDGARYELSELVGPSDLPELDITPFQKIIQPYQKPKFEHPPDYARTIAWAEGVLHREYFSFDHAGGDLGLFRAACFLIQRARLDPRDAKALLMRWNQCPSNVDVPWPQGRIDYKISEAMRLRK